MIKDINLKIFKCDYNDIINYNRFRFVNFDNNDYLFDKFKYLYISIIKSDVFIFNNDCIYIPYYFFEIENKDLLFLLNDRINDEFKYQFELINGFFYIINENNEIIRFYKIKTIKTKRNLLIRTLKKLKEKYNNITFKDNRINKIFINRVK